MGRVGILCAGKKPSQRCNCGDGALWRRNAEDRDSLRSCPELGDTLPGRSRPSPSGWTNLHSTEIFGGCFRESSTLLTGRLTGRRRPSLAVGGKAFAKRRGGRLQPSAYGSGGHNLHPRLPRCPVCPVSRLCKLGSWAFRRAASEEMAKLVPHYTVAAAVIARRGRV